MTPGWKPSMIPISPTPLNLHRYAIIHWKSCLSSKISGKFSLWPEGQQTVTTRTLDVQNPYSPLFPITQFFLRDLKLCTTDTSHCSRGIGFRLCCWHAGILPETGLAVKGLSVGQHLFPGVIDVLSHLRHIGIFPGPDGTLVPLTTSGYQDVICPK